MKDMGVLPVSHDQEGQDGHENAKIGLKGKFLAEVEESDGVTQHNGNGPKEGHCPAELDTGKDVELAKGRDLTNEQIDPEPEAEERGCLKSVLDHGRAAHHIA